MQQSRRVAATTWLSPAQKSDWLRDGLLVREGVFTHQEVDAMRAEADAILRLAVNSSIFHDRRSARLDWRLRADGTQLVRKIQPINDISETFARFGSDPRMTGPLEELMGQPPTLFEEKLNYKQPLHTPVQGLPPPADIGRPDGEWGMHNDFAYYTAQDYPQSSVSSAVVLDDCTASNGPLRMWRGSHVAHRPHDSDPALGGAQQVRALGDPLVDPAAGEALLLPAGSILHFSVLTVHNSDPNRSNAPRRLMIFSHHPTSHFRGPRDLRNGGTRRREAPYEQQYLAAVAAGKLRTPPWFTLQGRRHHCGPVAAPRL
jgi:hypothetical protein